MPLDGSEVEKDFDNLSKRMKGVAEETKRFADDAAREIKNFGDVSAETKAKADEALVKMAETNARLAEIEQRLARRSKGDEPRELKSLGDWVLDDPRVKAMNSGSRGVASIKVETKDITSASSTAGAGVSPSTSLVVADRGRFSPINQRRMTVRDLITPGETSSSAIEFVQEVSFTNNAAPVAETTQKPKSDITFNLLNVPVRTIAHFIKASRQILDDAPQLRSIIDNRLRYGLAYVEEAQLLYGSGTGANIRGIIPQATAYAAPFTVSGATVLDQVRLGLLQASVAEYPATGIVMHPSDLARVELLKDTAGKYLVGDPQGNLAPRLWGIPVVATPAIAMDTVLIGAFNQGAQLFDRMGVEVLISSENSDDFEKNMLTIRAEERLALAVYRTQAFIVADLGFVA